MIGKFFTMDKLTIDARDKSPEIILDPEEGFIRISGISDEEDALATYFPVLQWLDSYVAHPKTRTRVELEFKYYNTASAKSLYEVLKRISKLKQENQKVDVYWFYEQGDENMLNEIENFSDIAHLPINAVERKD